MLDLRRLSGRHRTLGALLVILAIMLGVTSYSVTLYRLFCSFTGANGTTQRVADNDTALSAREVLVRFNTDVAPGMPWRFTPVQQSVTLHLGENKLVFFRAENLSDHAITGHATFNVTPDKSGLYFKKIQCFCFTEERLGPHQAVDMPVTFFVDPALARDPNTEDVDQITLSYTFFISKRPDGAADLARFTPGSPALGERYFVAQCSGCHAPDRARVGPALAGVVGRPAGSSPGYPYSAALAHANLTWTPATLDKWLANPQAFLPGALMPMHVADADERRAIIAYLATLHPEQQASAR